MLAESERLREQNSKAIKGIRLSHEICGPGPTEVEKVYRIP